MTAARFDTRRRGARGDAVRIAQMRLGVTGQLPALVLSSKLARSKARSRHSHRAGGGIIAIRDYDTRTTPAAAGSDHLV